MSLDLRLICNIFHCDLFIFISLRSDGCHFAELLDGKLFCWVTILMSSEIRRKRTSLGHSFNIIRPVRLRPRPVWCWNNVQDARCPILNDGTQAGAGAQTRRFGIGVKWLDVSAQCICGAVPPWLNLHLILVELEIVLIKWNLNCLVTPLRDGVIWYYDHSIVLKLIMIMYRRNYCTCNIANKDNINVLFCIKQNHELERFIHIVFGFIRI